MALIASLLARAYRALDTLIDATIVLSYGRTGYKIRRALMWDEADLDVDLTGKVCAITGANSGIGLRGCIAVGSTRRDRLSSPRLRGRSRMDRSAGFCSSSFRAFWMRRQS